jgi:hypothetical protein
MTITLSALQKQRRDSAANWTAENPTLLAGEIGIESDTGYWKVGDGSTAWTSLAYIPWSQLSAYPLVDDDIAAAADIAGTKIQQGSTSTRGALQLTDGTNSTSTTTAATPSSVKTAYDLANAALPKSGGTVTGAVTFNAAVTVGDIDAVAAIKAQNEEAEIRRNSAFSVGAPGAIPYGIGPAIPPGMAFFGIGPDAYNPIHLPSGSFC